MGRQAAEGDEIRGRMRALADRARRLATAPVHRPQRRVRSRTPVRLSGSAYDRPVVVKVLYHDRARGAFPNTARALANYMAKQGPLFSRDSASVDPAAVAAAWNGDRRVFHVVVAPEHGMRLDDPVDWARTVVAAWESRTGPLEWVGAIETKADRAHPDGNRHLHVMIRGVQEGHDLVFDRDLIRHALRADAVRITTDRLGSMDERERLALLERRERARDEREIGR